MFAFYLLIDII